MKSIRMIKIIQMKSIEMNQNYTDKLQCIQMKKGKLIKSIRIENNIERKRALKCLFNKTKWKMHPTK